MLERIASHFQALLRATQLSNIPIRVMVIGVASPVDFENGVSVRPPIMPGWDGFPIAAWLRIRMQVPVLVDHDVCLMAPGEARSHPSNASPCCLSN